MMYMPDLEALEVVRRNLKITSYCGIFMPLHRTFASLRGKRAARQAKDVAAEGPCHWNWKNGKCESASISAPFVSDLNYSLLSSILKTS